MHSIHYLYLLVRCQIFVRSSTSIHDDDILDCLLFDKRDEAHESRAGGHIGLKQQLNIYTESNLGCRMQL